MRRLSHRELYIQVEFDRPVTETTWIEISLAHLILHEHGSAAWSFALSMPRALWNPKWSTSGPVQVHWNEAKTSFDYTVVLPEKFERIPDVPEILCEPPAEAPWPFMTSDEWRSATDPWGSTTSQPRASRCLCTA